MERFIETMAERYTATVGGRSDVEEAFSDGSDEVEEPGTGPLFDMSQGGGLPSVMATGQPPGEPMVPGMPGGPPGMGVPVGPGGEELIR